MKKNTLYTASKYNKDAFARYLEEEKNMFPLGGDMVTPYYKDFISIPQVTDVLSTTPVLRKVPTFTSPLMQQAASKIGNAISGALPGSSSAIGNVVSGATSSVAESAKTPWVKTPQGQQSVKAIGQLAAAALSPVVSKVVSNGYSSGAGSTISGLAPIVGSAVSMIPGVGALAGPIASLATSAVGALTNRAIGTKRNEENIAALKNVAGIMRSVGSTVDNSTDALRGRMRNFATKINFNNKGDLVKSGFLNRKKGIRESNNLLAMQDAAEAFQNNSIGLSLDNIAKGVGGQAYLDSFAYGGPLSGMGNIDPSTAIGYDILKGDQLIKQSKADAQEGTLISPFAGVSGNMFGNTMASGGKIHIKKANRGKFTEQAKRAGMSVQQFAAHVLANKNKYSADTVKRANFARNASKWHAYGGYLDDENVFAGGGIEEVGPGDPPTRPGLYGSGTAFINSLKREAQPIIDLFTGGSGGTMGGASDGFGGAGSGGDFYVPSTASYRDNEFRGVAWPTEETFNEAYARARKEYLEAKKQGKKAKDTFWFNGREYSVAYDNSNNPQRAKAHKEAGDKRKRYGFNGAGKWKYAEGGLLNEDNLYALGGESFPSDMTLDEAYEKARERGQEYFYFNGKRYSTGLTADTKTYAEGGSLMDNVQPVPSKQRPFTDEELIEDAGEEFPGGIHRRNNGTYYGVTAEGQKVVMSEEQVRDQLDKVRKRRVQEQTEELQNKYAEGGEVEVSQEMPPADMGNAGVPMEGVPQEQGSVPMEEPVEGQESQGIEEGPQEELPELGEVLDVTPEEAQELKSMGYEFKVIEK